MRTMRSAACWFAGKCMCDELRDRVADALVDGAADFAAHRVRDRDVHVGRRDRRRHRLEPIADADHDVGLEHDRRWSAARADREPVDLAIVRRRLALDDHRDLRVGVETVGFDHVDDRSEAIEQRRGADDELKLQIRVRRDRAHHRLDAAVVGAGTNEDADFSHRARSLA